MLDCVRFKNIFNVCLLYDKMCQCDGRIKIWTWQPQTIQFNKFKTSACHYFNIIVWKLIGNQNMQGKFKETKFEPLK